MPVTLADLPACEKSEYRPELGPVRRQSVVAFGCLLKPCATTVKFITCGNGWAISDLTKRTLWNRLAATSKRLHEPMAMLLNAPAVSLHFFEMVRSIYLRT